MKTLIVKCLISLLCAGIFSSPALAVEKYAMVKDGKIVKYKAIDSSDEIIKPKLIAHGYLIVIEGAVPAYDSITQILIDSYTITKDSVIRTYTLQNKTLDEAKIAKKNDIETKALNEISACFNLIDQDSKVTLILDDKDIDIVSVNTALTIEDLQKIDVADEEVVYEIK